MAHMKRTKYGKVDLDYVLGIGGFDLERSGFIIRLTNILLRVIPKTYVQSYIVALCICYALLIVEVLVYRTDFCYCLFVLVANCSDFPELRAL